MRFGGRVKKLPTRSSMLVDSLLLELRNPKVHPQTYDDDVAALAVGKPRGLLL